MPTLTHDTERHVVVDRRPGHYLSFPDIGLSANGRLFIVYREADQHVARRSKLLLRNSDDGGATWSPARVLNATRGHCPRFSRLRHNHLVIIDDASSSLYWSLDDGNSWTASEHPRLQHSIPDRLIELDEERLLTTAHGHRGKARQPLIGQSSSEQMMYLSEDRGATFDPLSVLARDRCLVLCEASIVAMPDGRLVAIMRENSWVHEPMYCAVSDDGGSTWSLPTPTPLIGHRPCIGLTHAGQVLVTYRNVAPDSGTVAWMGSLDELLHTGFQVHGLAPGPDQPTLTPEGLHVHHPTAGRTGTYYALRPLTDPTHASASLEAVVTVDAADPDAAALYLGTLWRLTSTGIRPEIDGAESVSADFTQPRRVSISYDGGCCVLQLDGEERLRIQVPAGEVGTRRVGFGTVLPSGEATSSVTDAGGHSLWQSVSLHIEEPRYGRDYNWQWTPDAGLPDAYARSRVLELQNDRHAHAGDFGYSGWVEPAPGEFLCAYHHGGGSEPDYEPGRRAHIVVTRFNTGDLAPT